jgi:hypothetical protein
MKGKRAQAAMEFLMTYGWAILIILVAIAALAYFGVLNPTRYVADICTLPVPMACRDFSVSESNGLQIVFVNGDAEEITITQIEATAEGYECDSGVITETVASGESVILEVAPGLCTSLSATQDKVKTPLKVSYTAKSGLDKVITGEIYSKIAE